jgi:hypothetical protein
MITRRLVDQLVFENRVKNELPQLCFIVRRKNGWILQGTENGCPEDWVVES